MSAFEALPIWIIDRDDAASPYDLVLFGLTEKPFAREAVDYHHTSLLAAFGADEACGHAASAR